MTDKKADDIIVTEEKEVAAIHNMQAHKLGIAWGKEVQKRNGADIKNLRKAVDIIADSRDVADVVEAYVSSGGDKATASRIKKILTVAFIDPAARAIVFDETSNSLQGCYKKIRELEKGTEQINDGESEVTEALQEETHAIVAVPAGVDVAGMVEQLLDWVYKIEMFDDKGAMLLKKAADHLASYETVTGGDIIKSMHKRKAKPLAEAVAVQ